MLTRVADKTFGVEVPRGPFVIVPTNVNKPGMVEDGHDPPHFLIALMLRTVTSENIHASGRKMMNPGFPENKNNAHSITNTVAMTAVMMVSPIKSNFSMIF